MLHEARPPSLAAGLDLVRGGAAWQPELRVEVEVRGLGTCRSPSPQPRGWARFRLILATPINTKEPGQAATLQKPRISRRRDEMWTGDGSA